MRLIVDAHLDLAWNTTAFDRDLTLPLHEMRAAEASMEDAPLRGRGTVTFPEMRRGGIGICIATLLSRSGPDHRRLPRYRRTDLDHATRLACHAAAHGQLACYRQWESQGEIHWIRTRRDLSAHWQLWTSGQPLAELPIGVVLSMEGADPILSSDTLSQWWDLGLRAIGPAHYGRSHFACGTSTTGPLTEEGRQLLQTMQRLGMALDVTHLSDDSMREAFDLFDGPVWASHHACRELVPGDRQLTDPQILTLAQRDAVIGVPFDAWMLSPNWKQSGGDRSLVGLQNAVHQVDHVCQLTGHTRCVGIGSDLDGGFGTEQTPHDLDSIADLQRFAERLSEHGYTDHDIDAICHGNWLRRLADSLPQ
ncbi:membrane dipeptidase [Bremerella sp. JC770]|uniref:dipeptidase n=1 Tax=Bremerella sp. JC770 TaxID=3232137 RepID=UPI00345A3107